ncbi:MAG: FaeA/PapI family transcriptional regulator [Nanoarchaeota archaeon]
MNIRNIKVAVLRLTEKSRVVTTAEIATSLKISWNTAEKYLLELALEGKVERIKKTGANIWIKRGR